MICAVADLLRGLMPIKKSSNDKQNGLPVGQYANYFRIGHSSFEFVIDCGQYYSGDKKVWFHTRIITSPAYCKALFATFEESIGQYERTFGAIPKK